MTKSLNRDIFPGWIQDTINQEIWSKNILLLKVLLFPFFVVVYYPQIILHKKAFQYYAVDKFMFLFFAVECNRKLFYTKISQLCIFAGLATH